MFSCTSSAYSGEHNLGEGAPEERASFRADKIRELFIGVQDHVAMYDDRLVDAIGKLGE